MDAHEHTPRIQVISVCDSGRRRRWADEEKVRIVKESLGDGVILSEVARRYEVSRSQLYDWRYRYRHGLLGCGPQFLRVLNIDEAPDGPNSAHAPAAQSPVMTVDFGVRCRVSIPSCFDMEAAARLLNSLAAGSWYPHLAGHYFLYLNSFSRTNYRMSQPLMALKAAA